MDNEFRFELEQFLDLNSKDNKFCFDKIKKFLCDAEKKKDTVYPSFVSTTNPCGYFYIVKNPLQKVVRTEDCWTWKQYLNRTADGLKRAYYNCGKKTAGETAKTYDGTFSKFCFRLDGSQVNATLAYYNGNSTDFHPEPHGNSNGSNFFSTATENCRETIDKQLKLDDGKVKNAYRNLCSQPPEFSAHLPRNTKQVAYAKAAMLKKVGLFADYFSMIHLLHDALGFGHFIHGMQSIKETFIYLADERIIEFSNKMLKQEDPGQLISIDTTFNMTSLFVTVVTIRNIYLDGNPLMPLFFLLHARKTESTFKFFFKDFVFKRLKLNSVTPIVSDRDKGLVNALSETLKAIGYEGNYLFCGIHLITDIKFWLRKEIRFFKHEAKKRKHQRVKRVGQLQKKYPEMQFDRYGAKINVSTYAGQAWNLLKVNSMEDFDQLLNEYSSTWFSRFKKYFDKNILEPMKKTVQVKLDFDGNSNFKDSVPNSNPSESMNHMLKSHTNNKKLRPDRLVVSLYSFVNKLMREHNRACNSTGDHQIKPEYQKSRLSLVVNVETFCPDKLDQELVQCKDHLYRLQAVKKEAAPRSCEVDLAEHAINGDLVDYWASQHLWQVQSPNIKLINGIQKRERFYLNKDGKKLICSCGKKSCFHRMCVDIHTNQQTSSNFINFDISKLRSHTKAYRKSGKKGADDRPEKTNKKNKNSR